MSLTQITDILKEKGFSSHKGYISKLQNGKLPPAGENLNNALAEITGGDSEKLNIEAYKEKAPKRLKDIFERVDKLEQLQHVFPYVTKDLIKAVSIAKVKEEKFSEFLINSLNESGMKIDEEKKDILKKPYNINYETLQIFNVGENTIILEALYRFLKNHDLDTRELLNDALSSKKRQMLDVPILGNIPAGEPIMAEENVMEWKNISNPNHYQDGDLFMLVVQGDSMTGSRIFDGDQVLVKVQQEVENGEIAVVNVNGNDATLKRVKKTDEGQVILYPDNPKYDPIFITDGKTRICGKVIQVMFEPKRGF